MNHLDISHARTEEQRKQMEELVRLGICPFCRAYFEEHHKNPILHETNHWLITRNDYPYEGVEEQLLVVAKIHITSPSELAIEGWSDLHNILVWVQEYFSRPGGSFLMRFGDTTYTGGTVEHLHAHLIFGASQKEGNPSLKVKVGYSNKKA